MYSEEYNTRQEKIILKEYGRGVQKVVQEIIKEEDKAKRTQMGLALVELMKRIKPEERDSQDANQRLWSHIHVIAGFEVEFENAPYPAPNKEGLERKPDKVPYQNNKIAYRHYGKNIELLIEQGKQLEDAEEREKFVIYIGKVMKRFYSVWNKTNVEDETILSEIKRLSKGELTIELDKVKAGRLFESSKPNYSNNQDRGGRDRSNGGRRNKRMSVRKNVR